ncbi:outer segment membrane [Mactra antiquata]
MAGPVFNFTEDGRRNLAKFVGIAHWLCILPSFVCLLTALYIQIQIQDKIAFIENYDGVVLPVFLVFSGCFGFFAHIFCGKVAYSCRVPEKREKWSGFLLAVIIATSIIFLAEFISGILCFVHIANLEESLDKGIKVAMAAYKNDATTKEHTDILQMTYECCGSRSHKDWFYVSWIHPDYRSNYSLSLSSGLLGLGPNLISDDVPFSCCNPDVLRPCINHHVHDNNKHYNYDYRTQTTLYTMGCTEKLMEFYENSVLLVAGSIVFGLSFLQLMLVITTRLLQTSISTSMSNEDHDGPSVGYLFDNPDPFAGLQITTRAAEHESLLDSTGDTPDEDEFNDITDERYVEMDGAVENQPSYENIRPAENGDDDEEHIYNEGDVEEYLAMRYANSREKFEPITETEYEEPEIPPPPMYEEPVYENINQSRNIPSLTRVDSNYGSYMSMSPTNPSSPGKIMRQGHFLRRQPNRVRSSPILHRYSPSPQQVRSKHNGTFVINMAANSPKMSKSLHDVRNFTQSLKPCSIHRATPRPKCSSTRPPQSVLRKYSSPTISPRKLQIIHDNHSLVNLSSRTSDKRPSSSRRSSPKRPMSSPRTTFKQGISNNCNHALH